jgi:hypothetical protein
MFMMTRCSGPRYWSSHALLVELDDYYTLAFTGNALATSEFQMPEIAATEFSRHFGAWHTGAQRHLKQHLLEQDVVSFSDTSKSGLAANPRCAAEARKPACLRG